MPRHPNTHAICPGDLAPTLVVSRHPGNIAGIARGPVGNLLPYAD